MVPSFEDSSAIQGNTLALPTFTPWLQPLQDRKLCWIWSYLLTTTWHSFV